MTSPSCNQCCVSLLSSDSPWQLVASRRSRCVSQTCTRAAVKLCNLRYWASPEDGCTAVADTVQVRDGKKFLKGLAVIDDIAYFGVSVWSERSARGDPSQDSELAAFCLRSMKLLWRREVSSCCPPATTPATLVITGTLRCMPSPTSSWAGTTCVTPTAICMQTLVVPVRSCASAGMAKAVPRIIRMASSPCHLPARVVASASRHTMSIAHDGAPACAPQVPTQGLLNVVAAPQLAVSSTYRALDPGLPRPTGRQKVHCCTSCVVFTQPYPTQRTLG